MFVSDLENLMIIFARADIGFKIDAERGWHKRLVMTNDDRCYCFKTDGMLATIRTKDDFDEFK